MLKPNQAKLLKQLTELIPGKPISIETRTNYHPHLTQPYTATITVYVHDMADDPYFTGCPTYGIFTKTFDRLRDLADWLEVETFARDFTKCPHQQTNEPTNPPTAPSPTSVSTSKE